jgi:hypothetical protein
MGHTRLSGEEIESRGESLYRDTIRSEVEPGNAGKVCVIDVETGEYVVDDLRSGHLRRRTLNYRTVDW